MLWCRSHYNLSIPLFAKVTLNPNFCLFCLFLKNGATLPTKPWSRMHQPPDKPVTVTYSSLILFLSSLIPPSLHAPCLPTLTGLGHLSETHSYQEANKSSNEGVLYLSVFYEWSMHKLLRSVHSLAMNIDFYLYHGRAVSTHTLPGVHDVGKKGLYPNKV